MRSFMIAATMAALTATPLYAQQRDNPPAGAAPSGGAHVSDTFSVLTELQGLYDEISQATLQFTNESDVDLFHDVIYAPDWMFTDGAGHTQTWKEMRAAAVQALSEPLPDSIVQPIQKLTPVPNGATAIVNLTTVSTGIDVEERHGRPGALHTLTVTTMFRDAWVHGSDGWKLKSRQQVGQPKQLVDQPEF